MGTKRTAVRRKDEISPAEEKLTPRDAIIVECQDFALQVVSRLMKALSLPSSMREEFESAGVLGLVEAAERFDPEKGADFRAFAFLRIRGAVIDHIRSCCTLTGQAYRTFKAMEASQTIELEGLTESARSREESRLGHALDFLSKSAFAYKLARHRGEEVTLEPTGSNGNPEQILSERREAERLKRYVAGLPERERMIIEQYYFQDKRFVEVAQECEGLSKSWISRLHDRALALLRDEYHRADKEELRNQATSKPTVRT